jgi:hypothetical protein
MTKTGKASNGTLTAIELGGLLMKFGTRKVFIIEDELQDKICPIQKASVTYNEDGVYICPSEVMDWYSSDTMTYKIGKILEEV